MFFSGAILVCLEKWEKAPISKKYKKRGTQKNQHLFVIRMRMP